jgi:hypothetical protein
VRRRLQLHIPKQVSEAEESAIFSAAERQAGRGGGIARCLLDDAIVRTHVVDEQYAESQITATD